RLASELTSLKPAVVVSGVQDANALDVALAVAAINQASAAGGAANGLALTSYDGIAPVEQLIAAVERMRGGQVGIAFVRGTNPAYYLPKALNFADAFAKVPFKVSFSSYPDETSELCDIVLPDIHSLESWGDATPVRGTIGLLQPVMDTVFPNVRATADVLIALGKKDPANAAKYPTNDYRSLLISRFP